MVLKMDETAIKNKEILEAYLLEVHEQIILAMKKMPPTEDDEEGDVEVFEISEQRASEILTSLSEAVMIITRARELTEIIFRG